MYYLKMRFNGKYQGEIAAFVTHYVMNEPACGRGAEARDAAGRVVRGQGGHPAPLAPQHHGPPFADAALLDDLRPAGAQPERHPTVRPRPHAQLHAPGLAEQVHHVHLLHVPGAGREPRR